MRRSCSQLLDSLNHALRQSGDLIKAAMKEMHWEAAALRAAQVAEGAVAAAVILTSRNQSLQRILPFFTMLGLVAA
jgi:hypothetical protein